MPKEREARRPFNEMRTYVTIRGIDVLVTPRVICQYYDAPYYFYDFLFKIDLCQFESINMEEVIVLTKGRELWTY